MTTEDKELLLRDLVARLPYGTIVRNYATDEDDALTYSLLEDFEIVGLEYIKPYLRPMSSMTEEERGQYMEFIEWSHNDYDGTTTTCIIKERLHEYIDFIYSHHFDDNGLIEKGGRRWLGQGLALEAKEGMYE